MKKGQLGNLQGIVITLIIVGVLLGVGLYVLSEFQEEAETGSASVVNETLTTVTTAGEFVSKIVMSAFKMDVNSVSCFNYSDASLIPTTNYTVAVTGNITFTAEDEDSFWGDQDWNCSYSYTFGKSAWEGMNKTSQAISKIPAWLVIIVIISIVGIVLSIVFGIFPGFGGSGFGGGSVTKGAGKGFSRIGSGGKGGSEGTAEV